MQLLDEADSAAEKLSPGSCHPAPLVRRWAGWGRGWGMEPVSSGGPS